MSTATPGPLLRYPGRRRVTGDLRVWAGVELPGLDRRSDIYVWLPPGYRRRRKRYPVIYLHDGGNLFDPVTSFAGATWGVDQALTHLHDQGLDAIAVGVPCSPTRRIEEYTTTLNPQVRAELPELGEPLGEAYLAFLVDHLKPWVDATLRTRAQREHTLVAGSSMGGVISMAAWLRYPEVFGGVGAFSTAFWVPGERFLADLEAALGRPGPSTRFYLDVGGHEVPESALRQAAYQNDTERIVAALRQAGAPVRYTYDSAAYHFETAWAERLPAALAWLLAGYAVPPPGGERRGLRGAAREVLKRVRIPRG